MQAARLILLMALPACGGTTGYTEGAGTTTGGEATGGARAIDERTARGAGGGFGSARRPDPTPWVPAPEGEGAPARTGEVAAVAPGGPHAAVRGAYVDFVRRVLAGDWAGLVEIFAPQVGLLGRPQTMERADVIRRLRQRIDRMQLQGARVEDILDLREIRVRTIAPDAARTSPLQPGDLQVTATPRLPSQRSPSGPFDETPQLSMVFRRHQGRWLVIAGDF